MPFTDGTSLQVGTCLKNEYLKGIWFLTIMLPIKTDLSQVSIWIQEKFLKKVTYPINNCTLSQINSISWVSSSKRYKYVSNQYDKAKEKANSYDRILIPFKLQRKNRNKKSTTCEQFLGSWNQGSIN